MSYGCGLWSDNEVMSFVYNNLEVFILMLCLQRNADVYRRFVLFTKAQLSKPFRRCLVALFRLSCLFVSNRCSQVLHLTKAIEEIQLKPNSLRMSACLKLNSVILIIISYFCTVAHNGHIKTKCSQQIQITHK